MQNATQAQLDERVRYTEAMLATTLAAIKKTAEVSGRVHARRLS